MAEVRTRLANLADAPVVLRMIRGLAQHLDQGDDFTATLDDLRRDGFGPDPRYESVLAEIGARPAGLATYFPMYSTFTDGARLQRCHRTFPRLSVVLQKALGCVGWKHQ